MYWIVKSRSMIIAGAGIKFEMFDHLVECVVHALHDLAKVAMVTTGVSTRRQLAVHRRFDSI